MENPGAATGRIASLTSPSRVSLPRYGSQVGLRIVLFEVCSAFTRVTACTLAMLHGVSLDFCLYPADDTLDYLPDMVHVLTADRPRHTRNAWLHIALVRNLVPAVHDLRELPLRAAAFLFTCAGAAPW